MSNNNERKLSVNLEESFYGAIGTDDCHKVGIMGGCGLECWVYLEGRCEVANEMINRLVTQEDKELHNEMYRK